MRTLLILSVSGLVFACQPTTEAGPAATPPAPEAAASQAAAPDASGWTSFGDGVTAPHVVTIGEMLRNTAKYEGQQVAAEGRVSEVCQKAGCWMVLSDEARHVRILMKDHNFSVDKAGSGRLAQVQGTLMSKAIDPAEVAHFASETRDGGVVPENAALDGKTWEIVATGVRMKTSM